MWNQQDWLVLNSALAVAPVGDSLLYAQGIVSQPGGKITTSQPRLQKVALVTQGNVEIGNSAMSALRGLMESKAPEDEPQTSRAARPDS